MVQVRIKPEASFDTLYIGTKIEDKIQDFALYEIHFFSYLACLLSLYDGQPLSFWEYGFIKSSFGSPYSSELHSAWDLLVAKESIIISSEGFAKMTEKGRDEIKFYLTLNTFQEREKYLAASCKSLSFVPMGCLQEAISNEPVLRSARLSAAKRMLLDEESVGYKVLYDQLHALKKVLEDKYKNLLIPAVVWIEYLRQKIDES